MKLHRSQNDEYNFAHTMHSYNSYLIGMNHDACRKFEMLKVPFFPLRLRYGMTVHNLKYCKYNFANIVYTFSSI